MTEPFVPADPAALDRLVDAYPLGWIVPTADPSLASPMPLLLGKAEPRALLGHLPLAGALAGALRTDPRATFLFQGPAGYISPALVDGPNWAPTWNFAVAVVTGTVRFDELLTDTALDRLVAHVEKQQTDPWRVAEMGERYPVLRARVIGFEAAIEAVRVRFKLGQDESEADFGTIVERHPDRELAAWMRNYR
ncbi:FMN-binding negative transcriptional regulator [Sphingomonas ginkgonis]|uniref:FMN-binding negative transcriptional regulator n=1 Tax=Sphingomonas ginkgonis TaxID=2315330 RepID=A0A3S0ELD5_9SPHN|nr:FMN-binding negative transcriptional regulator [Sphingomonas ginkgonis]RST30263.1 FMN-binding negative transcriptional regulator [Sphingomonas ginkgonis]